MQYSLIEDGRVWENANRVYGLGESVAAVIAEDRFAANASSFCFPHWA